MEAPAAILQAIFSKASCNEDRLSGAEDSLQPKTELMQDMRCLKEERIARPSSANENALRGLTDFLCPGY